MDREERNRRMRENRALLRAAGFSSKDIDRLKNASPATIQRMIESRQVPEKKTGGGRGRKAEVMPEPVKVETPVPEKTYRYGGRTETKEQRNLRLRQTQELLRAAGLSKEDAARLRNASPETIREILRTGQAPEKRHHYLRKIKEHSFSALPWKSTRKRYTSRYNVVLEILFARKVPSPTGYAVEYKTEFVTIQANFELSREDAMEAANDIITQAAEEPTEGSDWELLDVRIVGCFINPDVAARPRPANWTKYKD